MVEQDKATLQKKAKTDGSPGDKRDRGPLQRIGIPAGYLAYYGVRSGEGTPGKGQDGDAAFALQRREAGATALTDSQMHEAAAEGIAGGGGALPHLDRIQAAFGRHDVSGVQAHTGPQAARAAAAIGANAYAAGTHVAFSGTPDLHTAAHEAAHVVQQRGGVQLKGGVGEVGDAYEQHADAVADRVVRGHSAEGLLDQMAGQMAGASASSGGGAGLQGRFLQLDIKSEIRDAMRGWGSGEDRIFARIARATQDEITSVVNDAALMEELRKDLSKSAMERLVDQMDAPLPYKLRLAMRGWGNDNDYIMRSLQNANAAQIHLVLTDAALMTQLQNDLGRDTATQVMQRLNAPLKDRLRAAMHGWGHDGNFMFQSLSSAPLAEVIGLAQDRAMQGEIESEMSGAEGDRFRAQMARRIFVEGGVGQSEWAFYILQGLTLDEGKLAARMALYGSLAEQRALEDAVITNVSDLTRVLAAFKLYWNVAPGSSGGTSLNVDLVRRVHAQCKALPPQDARNGVWSRLTSEAGGGGSMSAAGDFHVGVGATLAGSEDSLTAAVAVGATQIPVHNAGIYQANAYVAIGPLGTGEIFQVQSADIPGKKYVAKTALTQAHAIGERVGPWQGASGTAELSANVAVGATEIFLSDVSMFGQQVSVCLGGPPAVDVRPVTAVDRVAKKLTLAHGLTHAFPAHTRAYAEGGSTSYGVGTSLSAPVATGANQITVGDPSIFQVGATLAIGPRPSADVKQVRAIAGNTYTLNAAVSKAYAQGTQVTPDDASASHEVSWVDAVVRHELGHSVDTAVGARGFYDLGGWASGTDFNAWAGTMGSPWTTNDGSVISEEDKAAIRSAIDTGRGVNQARPLNTGLAANHAINRYWNKAVPVIEAAKPCFAGGQPFWQQPTLLKKYGSKYFSINLYYGTYQSYNEQVQTARVRDYQIFSPAEFFAEVYTTFYEEAGTAAPADMGRMVPVGAWRDWIRTNVQNRGMAPGGGAPGGGAPGGGAGPASPAPTGASVGVKAHNPGM